MCRENATMVGWLLEFYGLTTSKVDIKMRTYLWQCTLMVTILCCHTWRPGHQHHDLISHCHIILTLSHLVLAHPNNAECLARKRQVSILKSLVWLDQGWKLQSSDSSSSKAGGGCSTHSAILSDHSDDGDDMFMWKWEVRGAKGNGGDVIHLILLVHSWLGSKKYQFLIHWFDSTRVLMANGLLIKSWSDRQHVSLWAKRFDVITSDLKDIWIILECRLMWIICQLGHMTKCSLLIGLSYVVVVVVVVDTEMIIYLSMCFC